MKKLFIAISVISMIFLVSACKNKEVVNHENTAQNTNNNSEVTNFSYSSNDELFTVSKKSFKIFEQLSPSILEERAKACEVKQTKQYFENLLSKYEKEDTGIRYEFKYNGKSQDSGIWIVEIIPNKLNYFDLTSFQKDFNICEAGAESYPTLISKENLLFASSCGTGYDNSSNTPHGCDLIRKFVEPTIKLK